MGRGELPWGLERIDLGQVWGWGWNVHRCTGVQVQ